MLQRTAFICRNRGNNPYVLQHIQLIILDLDYVVFDCSKLKLQALRQSLISLADIIPQNVRLPDEVDAEEGFREHGVQWIHHLDVGLGEENLENLRQIYELNEGRLIESGLGAIFQGLGDFVSECRSQNISLALGAEATRDYLVSVSDRHQLEGLFQISLCTEEFGSGSSEEMLEEVLHFAEANRSEAVVLGSRPRLFEAAHNLDMLTIGCGWGIRQHDALRDSDLQALTLPQLYPAIQKADQLASARY